ncbi:MAG: bifunctional DedA family/phosphatase PAP2 family protein [Ahrensia sp.]|nr:bifunctional DedA family/phosphatase PAP2 family protein [Ahrensia sp.]
MQTLLETLVVYLGNHPILAIFVVFLISMAEALFVVGLVVPSTVVLVGAGALIGAGSLAFWPIFLSATAGAVVGDALSYWIGHHYRERLYVIWPFSHHDGIIRHGQNFFARHGAKSIFIARFIPAVKSIVPGIAGMMGMNVSTFAIINVVSAFAWSAAHILPGIGIGNGLSRYWTSDPRFVALAALVVVAVLMVWFVTKLFLVVGVPQLGKLRGWLDEKLETRSGRISRASLAILRNEEGLAASLAWAIAIAGLLIVFTTILLNLLFEPQLAAADQAISAFIQGLRTPAGTAIMTLITMAGDSRVITALAVTSVGWLAFHRQWAVTAATLIAMVGATIFVPVVKATIQRARPNELYSGAESFSFPSGHATLSATIIGVVAILLAREAKGVWRWAIYGIAVAAVVAIAISRVYLAAHWPSDVLAGVAFGFAVAAALAYFLRRRSLPIHAPLFAAVLLLGFGIAYGLNVSRNFAKWTDNYAYNAPVALITKEDWVSGGWKNLPLRRGTFEGETAETFVLQAALPVDILKSGLSAAGWRVDDATELQRLSALALPTKAPLLTLPAAPRYDRGNSAVLTLTRTPTGLDQSRDILRFWPSGRALDQSGRPIPILLGGLSRERLDPLIWGYGELDSESNSDAGTPIFLPTAARPEFKRQDTGSGLILLYR